MKNWYGMKCIDNGCAIAMGPFESADKANMDRERTKASDVEVSPWFVSDTKKEAEMMAKWYLDGGEHPEHSKPENDSIKTIQTRLRSDRKFGSKPAIFDEASHSVPGSAEQTDHIKDMRMSYVDKP